MTLNAKLKQHSHYSRGIEVAKRANCVISRVNKEREDWEDRLCRHKYSIYIDRRIWCLEHA